MIADRVETWAGFGTEGASDGLVGEWGCCRGRPYPGLVNWELLGGIALAMLAAVAAVAQLLRVLPRQRDRIMQEVKLLNSLPRESAARQSLLDHIDQLILKSIKAEAELRRDPTGIVLGLILMGGGLIPLYYGWEAGGFVRAMLWVLAGFLLILGGMGFTQDVVPRERDERGRPVQ